MKDNQFEILRDKLAEKVVGRVKATELAFGVGSRPYGHVRLSPQEQKDYWRSLPDQERFSIWEAMSPEEQMALTKTIGGE